MRPLPTLAILLLASVPALAAEWVCPANVASLGNGEWCDASHAEYEAKEADKLLNEAYRALLKDYATPQDQELWRVAQRAWLKYYEVHCAAVASKGLVPNRQDNMCIKLAGSSRFDYGRKS